MRPLGSHADGDDVVHLRRGLGQPETGAREAHRFAPEHLGAEGLPAGSPWDTGLIEQGLIAYEAPLYQVSELPDPTPSSRAEGLQRLGDIL